MEISTRNAVRGFLIEDDKIVCIKYKTGRIGYYDTPGGEIEAGETEEQALIREFKEETGLTIKNPVPRGTIYLNYPSRKFILHTFIVRKHSGKMQEFEENETCLLPLREFIGKNNRFIDSMILEPSFLKILLDGEKRFTLNIDADENENILNLDFKVEEIDRQK